MLFFAGKLRKLMAWFYWRTCGTGCWHPIPSKLFAHFLLKDNATKEIE